MVVTITAKMVAVVGLIAVIFMGILFHSYRKQTDSILKMQDREIRRLKKTLDGSTEIINNDVKIIEMLNRKIKEYMEKEERRQLDEKMLLPTTQNKNEDLEF